MTNRPRGVLVVHSDLSEKVARMVVGEIVGKGHAVTRRNIRYGYFPEMYWLVLLIDVQDGKMGSNLMAYDYVPYSSYVKSNGSLTFLEYQNMYATRIARKVTDTLDFM